MNNHAIKNGIWIRVRNIGRAKLFYSQLFGLRDAVVETPDFAVFKVGNNDFYLVLELSNAPYLEHSCSANSFFLEVDDIERAEKVLQSFGKYLFKNILTFADVSYHRTSDLDGNVLVISESR